MRGGEVDLKFNGVAIVGESLLFGVIGREAIVFLINGSVYFSFCLYFISVYWYMKW